MDTDSAEAQVPPLATHLTVFTPPDDVTQRVTSNHVALAPELSLVHDLECRGVSERHGLGGPLPSGRGGLLPPALLLVRCLPVLGPLTKYSTAPLCGCRRF